MAESESQRGGSISGAEGDMGLEPEEAGGTGAGPQEGGGGGHAPGIEGDDYTDPVGGVFDEDDRGAQDAEEA